MKYKKDISVKQLARFINVHPATLNSWLCHFTLSRYVFEQVVKFGKTEKYFRINQKSIEALRNYLRKKSIKYYTFFQKRLRYIFLGNNFLE